MKTVAGYVPDLMDRSRVTAAIPTIRFVSDAPSILAASEDLVVVDVSRPGVLEHVRDVSGFVVGFGAHVDDELLAAAAEAGCDLVLPRSRFFRRLGELARSDRPDADGPAR